MIVDPIDSANAPAWTVALGSVVANVWQFIKAHRNAKIDLAAANATLSEYKADQTMTDAAAAQVAALLGRVESLEEKYTKLWDDLQAEKQASSVLRDRIRQLESILRSHDIPVPTETK